MQQRRSIRQSACRFCVFPFNVFFLSLTHSLQVNLTTTSNDVKTRILRLRVKIQQRANLADRSIGQIRLTSWNPRVWLECVNLVKFPYLWAKSYVFIMISANDWSRFVDLSAWLGRVKPA